jgi:hypothetical protein
LSVRLPSRHGDLYKCKFREGDNKEAKNANTKKPETQIQRSQKRKYKEAKNANTKKPKTQIQRSQKRDYKEAKHAIKKKPKARLQRSHTSKDKYHY